LVGSIYGPLIITFPLMSNNDEEEGWRFCLYIALAVEPSGGSLLRTNSLFIAIRLQCPLLHGARALIRGRSNPDSITHYILSRTEAPRAATSRAMLLQQVARDLRDPSAIRNCWPSTANGPPLHRRAAHCSLSENNMCRARSRHVYSRIWNAEFEDTALAIRDNRCTRRLFLSLLNFCCFCYWQIRLHTLLHKKEQLYRSTN